jgi:hypothetical protein
VNKKFELSAPYVGVTAEVTITVQAPAPVNVSTPVAPSTEHPEVFPLPDTAYEIAPLLLDTAPAAGVYGLCVVSKLCTGVQVIDGVAAFTVNCTLTAADCAFVEVDAATALTVHTPVEL